MNAKEDFNPFSVEYACHGSWREGSRNHVVATPLEPGPNHRVCVVSEEMRSYSDLHLNQGKGQPGLQSPQPTSRFLLLQGSCSSHSQAEIMAFNATFVGRSSDPFHNDKIACMQNLSIWYLSLCLRFLSHNHAPVFTTTLWESRHWKFLLGRDSILC